MFVCVCVRVCVCVHVGVCVCIVESLLIQYGMHGVVIKPVTTVDEDPKTACTVQQFCGFKLLCKVVQDTISYISGHDR